MKSFITCLFIGGAIAQNCAPIYSQCGGSGWTGVSSCCNAGASCQTQVGNPYYAQCLTATGSPLTTTPPPPPPTSTCAPSLSQCGGAAWTGASSCCDVGYSCQTQAGNSYYAQCLTGGTTAISTTMISTTSVSTTTVTNPTRVPYAGVNIAGFDFGCIDACDSNCPYPEEPPLPSQNGANGPGQMNHFVTDDEMNAFRLPVRWEYLVDGVLNGDLSESQFQIYDQLVQACITSGAELCIIDLHNYAHWNNYLIGSGGNAPSASSFATIWGQLASKYASDSQVAFGLMNEPHSGCSSDNLDMATWDSIILQGAVNAIRSAGATSQMILLPGSEWTHTAGYLNNNSNDLQMVLDITDPTDATGAKLIVEVHEYLSANNSGCSADANSCAPPEDSPFCVTDSIGTDNGRGGLQNFVDAMRELGPGRKAMLTETGGNNDATYGCATYLCQELSFLNGNSDVFIGWIGWAAGSFDATKTDQEVNITPTDNNNIWTDAPLVTQCFAPCFTEGC